MIKESEFVKIVAAAMDEFWKGKEDQILRDAEAMVRRIFRDELRVEVREEVIRAVKALVESKVYVTLEVKDGEEGEA